MNVSPDPFELGDAEALTAIYLRSVMPEGTDVRADLTVGWDGTTDVIHVHRVGGPSDRFRDRARIAIDAKAHTRDAAFALITTARGWLRAWPARPGTSCRGSSEELGPTYLPVTGELPTVAMTWVITI